MFDLELPENWRERILASLQTDSPDVQRVQQQRHALGAQLERLKQLFLLGDLSEAAYHTQRTAIQTALDQLPVLDVPIQDLEQAAALLTPTSKS